MRRLLLILAAAITAAGAAAGAARAEDVPCPGAKVPAIALPRLREAVANNQEVTIVALGSSSTQGWHATDIAHSYPAILQQELTKALPTAHVAVLNRGIGGQDVTEMLPRLERDVLGARPTVVIWQVGANGAMRRMAPELFKKLLTTGVHRLREARVDVVLMDNQRAPAILASPDHVRIDQALADVAVATGAGLFGRGALMDQWRQAGHGYEQFVSDDGVHHNDVGYRCVAKALSAAIVDGMGASPLAQGNNAVAAKR
jgi:acyl-CoA thioesterase I